MFLILEHPLVAYRDCNDCQAYHYDERTGERATSASGEPVHRDEGIVPPCRTEIGCPKGTPEESRALSPRNWAAYEHFRRCRAVGRFPSDSLVERNAAIIDDCERASARSMAKLQVELLKIWLTSHSSTT